MIREIIFRAWHMGEKKMYFRGYQKFSHILLCEDDCGKNEGKGLPVKRAGYDDCELLEGSGIKDCKGAEIFEGDMIRVNCGDRQFEGVLDGIPDMFRSRGLHPLHNLLIKNGCTGEEKVLNFEIVGNRYTGKADT